jgi:hypothetical protein
MHPHSWGMTTKLKRPRDTNQLAHKVVALATGEVPEAPIDSAAVAKAKKAGAVGGPARARALTSQQRSEIAKVAALTRWKKGD